MNKFIAIGRSTKDPDVRYTQGNQPMAVARFTLAVDRKFKKDGEPSADFISCIAFGKLGEFVEKYVKRGTKVAIEGRWQTGSYKKDDKTIYTNDCVIESIEFAESKKEEKAPEPSDVGDGFINIPDNIEESELPFA